MPHRATVCARPRQAEVPARSAPLIEEGSAAPQGADVILPAGEYQPSPPRDRRRRHPRPTDGDVLIGTSEVLTVAPGVLRLADIGAARQLLEGLHPRGARHRPRRTLLRAPAIAAGGSLTATDSVIFQLPFESTSTDGTLVLVRTSVLSIDPERPEVAFSVLDGGAGSTTACSGARRPRPGQLAREQVQVRWWRHLHRDSAHLARLTAGARSPVGHSPPSATPAVHPASTSSRSLRVRHPPRRNISARRCHPARAPAVRLDCSRRRLRQPAGGRRER